MRVAIAGYESADSFTENVATTLRQMGHEVATTPLARGGRTAARLRKVWAELRERSGRYVPDYERWLLRTCRAQRVDLVLAMTRSVTEETLRGLRRAGVRHLVAWWGDCPANMRGAGLMVPGWDAVFMKDHDAVDDLRRVGVNAHLLHEAMNPAWHRQVATQANGAIVVAGNWYGMRQALVRRLLQDGHRVDGYGPPLPRWADPAVRPAHLGRYIVKEEKSRIFGEGLACLNSMSLAEGDSLNCRAFEIAGAGGLQLIEHRPVIEQCFEPGKEVLSYRTYEELVEHIAWAKRLPAEAQKVRAAGARRALAEHTYRHRLERMLAVVGAG
jgi:spore maturation protein CgeB